MRLGNFSAYYFFDDYYLEQSISERPGRRDHSRLQRLEPRPRATDQFGRHQDVRHEYGKRSSFQLHAKRQRGGTAIRRAGTQLASQGFVTGAGTAGIYPLAPQFAGVENVVFQGDFVMGLPITNVNQANNTFTVSDSLSRVMGAHTLKFGVEVSFEQVNVNPDAIFNGTFVFDGYQTGSEFRGLSHRRAEPIQPTRLAALLSAPQICGLVRAGFLADQVKSYIQLWAAHGA